MEEPRTSDMPKDVKDSLDVKEQTNADKATETDAELYEDINISRENLQPIFESSEEAQTTVEPTFVDRETNEQEPNPAEIELCFTIDEKDKPPTKTTQQRQAILASVVGAVLLVSCVASYLLIEYSKVHVIAVVGGIVGLACIGLALYNIQHQARESKKCGAACYPISFESNICSKNIKQISNKLISLEESISY